MQVLHFFQITQKMSTTDSIEFFFPTVIIIRESSQAILPKLLLEEPKKKSIYELTTFKKNPKSTDGRFLSNLRIYIPEKVVCKPKSIFFNIFSTENEEIRSEKVIREELILPNETFFT